MVPIKRMNNDASREEIFSIVPNVRRETCFCVPQAVTVSEQLFHDRSCTMHIQV